MSNPSLLVRRTHMYLALFLFPWLLMYAASTAAMNHRAWFADASGASAPAFAVERELVYDGVFADDGDLKAMARQILASVDLDGAHGVTRRKDGAVVITRQDLLAPRRLTFTPSDRRLVIERMPHRTTALLERFHRRRGYATGYGLDTAWAISVDLAIAAMVFWVVSGLWMWWEMKVTRRLGAVALAGGAALFVLFLSAI